MTKETYTKPFVSIVSLRDLPEILGGSCGISSGDNDAPRSQGGDGGLPEDEQAGCS